MAWMSTYWNKSPPPPTPPPTLKVLLLHGETQPREEYGFPIDGALVHVVRQYVAYVLDESREECCVFKLLPAEAGGGALWYSTNKGETHGVLMGYNRHTGDFTHVSNCEATKTKLPSPEQSPMILPLGSNSIVEDNNTSTPLVATEVFYDSPLEEPVAISKRRLTPYVNVGGGRERRTPKKTKLLDL